MNDETYPLVSERPESWGELVTDLNNIETISLAGAGVTGVLYTGALRALHEQGLLENVKTFAGTSSGAIVGAAAALGYRGRELEKLGIEQNFKKFAGINWSWYRKQPQNHALDGIFSGGKIRDWVNTLCAKRIGKDSMTFADLETYKQEAEANNRAFFASKYDDAIRNRAYNQRHFDGKPYKFDFERNTRDKSIDAMMDIARGFTSLHVTATEIVEDVWQGKETERASVFNKNTSPNKRLSSAIRASASYPYYFRHAQVEDENGVKRYYTDGALSDPQPGMEKDESGKISNTVLGLASEYIAPVKNARQVTAEKVKETTITRISNRILGRLGLTTDVIKQNLAEAVGRKILLKNDPENFVKLPADEQRKAAISKGFRNMARDTFRLSRMFERVNDDAEIASHIIPLNRHGHLGTDFDITLKEKETLIVSAYETTRDVINQWRAAHKPAPETTRVTPRPPILPASERENSQNSLGK